MSSYRVRFTHYQIDGPLGFPAWKHKFGLRDRAISARNEIARYPLTTAAWLEQFVGNRWREVKGTRLSND